MEIRRTKDYELIARLNKPVHDLHVKLYPKYFKKYNFDSIKEVFKRMINNEGYVFLVLNDDQETIGYAWIEIKEYRESAFKKGYNSIYVHQICVEDSKRKKGYGSKMMEEIYSLAKERGIERIELDYWIENDVMNTFCDKQQFTKYREFVYKELF